MNRRRYRSGRRSRTWDSFPDRGSSRREPWELDGERAYYAIFGEYAAGFPIAHFLIVALVGDRSYDFALLARPMNFREFLPTAREMADSLEIQG